MSNSIARSRLTCLTPSPSVISLGSFGLDVTEKKAERLTITVTMLLTIVAFKLQLASNVPKLQYLTLLDKLLLFSFFFIGAVSCENILAPHLFPQADGIFLGLFLTICEWGAACTCTLPSKLIFLFYQGSSLPRSLLPPSSYSTPPAGLPQETKRVRVARTRRHCLRHLAEETLGRAQVHPSSDLGEERRRPASGRCTAKQDCARCLASARRKRSAKRWSAYWDARARRRQLARMLEERRSPRRARSRLLSASELSSLLGVQIGGQERRDKRGREERREQRGERRKKRERKKERENRGGREERRERERREKREKGRRSTPDTRRKKGQPSFQKEHGAF